MGPTGPAGWEPHGHHLEAGAGALLLTDACAGTGGGRPGPAPADCLSCFRGLPLDLTKLPGTPERRRSEKDLFFTDAAGLVWKADAGDVTDGASIPTIFLPITGPRFDPHFLPAAVMHDHYTDKAHLVRTWRSTARVFYEAMRANATPAVKAKLMFYAVHVFGPHWGRLAPGVDCGPNCVNLTGEQSAPLRTLDQDGGAGELRFEEAHATAGDLAELREVRARIAAGEASKRPLGLDDLEREAAMRHADKPFLAR